MVWNAKAAKKPSANIFPIFQNDIPEDKFIDFIHINKKFKNYLNKEIPILDLSEELRKEVKKNPNLNLFWNYDGHYTIEGYKLASEIVSNYLISIDNYHLKIE